MKRTARKKETICLCPYCLEAILSRGEKVRIIDHCDMGFDEEDPIICRWCDEETYEYYEVTF